MPRPIPRWVKLYGLVVMSLAVALVIRLLLNPVLDNVARLMIFLVAVAGSAWFGGLWAGLVATVGGALLGDYFLTRPYHAFAIADNAVAVELTLFVLEGALISAISEAHHRAQRRSDEASAMLRAATTELVFAEERQRRSLAQGLHDELQQLLIACRSQLWLIDGPLLTDDARKRIDIADDLLNQAVQYTQTLTSQLSPPVLHRLGLTKALDWLAGEMRELHRLEVETDLAGSDAPAADEITLTFYMAARELLFNIVKHAKTRHARLSLKQEGELIQVVVEDDGVGFDPASVLNRSSGAGGLGLFGIRERLHALGGRMEISSTLGRGTSIRLVAPMTQRQPQIENQPGVVARELSL